MTVFFTVLIIIVSILLILIVLVQNSKGGGLASNFASSNQFMGVRKTADFLEKATWSLAIALLFLCLFSSFSYKESTKAPKSRLENSATQQTDSKKVPEFPVNAPAGNQQTTTPAPAGGTQNNQNNQTKTTPEKK